MVLQKNNLDFMNPIRMQLTYDLLNVGELSMVPGTTLPDINNYPVVNKAEAEKNFSVSISCSVLCFNESVNLIDSVRSICSIVMCCIIRITL